LVWGESRLGRDADAFVPHTRIYKRGPTRESRARRADRAPKGLTAAPRRVLLSVDGPNRQEDEMLKLTHTQLRRLLRWSGCTQPREHARAAFACGACAPCGVTHRPTREDEHAANAHWFIRALSKRKLATARWTPSGKRNGRTHASDQACTFAQPTHEFAYASTQAILPEPLVGATAAA